MTVDWQPLPRFHVERLLDRRHGYDLFEGTDIEQGQRVWIKRFWPELSQSSAFYDQWHDRLWRLQELALPCIPTILEFGATDDGTLYQVEHPPTGIPLNRWLAETSLVEPEAAVRVGTAIVEALVPVHAAGLAHGALAPTTMYIHEEPHDHLQIAFGEWELCTVIAAGIDAPDVRPYAAPERLENPAAPLTTAADVYALGVVLYEMLTQHSPFAPNDTSRLYPIPPSRYNPLLSETLETLLLRCLHPDPYMRPPTARVLARALPLALHDHVHEISVSTPASASQTPETAPLASAWTPEAMFSMGVLTALAAVLLVVFVWQIAQPNAAPLPLATPVPQEQSAPPPELTPSAQIVAIPDVFGLSLEDATAVLEEAGLQVGLVRYAHDAAVPAGLVLEQNPRADVQVVAGTAVDLIVSLGPPSP
nr:PASTA domain-containing protein [Ardenticatena sp.]